MAKAIVAALAVLGAFVPATAAAAFGFEAVDVYLGGPGGAPAMQAGAHPHVVTTTVRMNTVEEAGFETPDGGVGNLRIEYPAGLVTAPAATPRCATVDFLDIEGDENDCSNSTAVGIVDVKVSASGPLPVGAADFPASAPVYNLIPPAGVLARVGFVADGQPLVADLGLDDAAPYRGFLALPVPENVLFYGARLSLWGVPADPSHDPDRGSCALGAGICPVATPQAAFITTPRACNGPLETLFSASSWQAPEQTVTATSLTHDGAQPPVPQGLAGCGVLAFAPAFGLALTTDLASTPVGLDLSVEVEDDGITNPVGLAQSEIERVELDLPKGMAINPDLDDGSGCTPAEFAEEGLEPEPGQGCPSSARVGEVEVESPLLPGELLEGGVFFSDASSPPALYTVLRHPGLGILIKQAGELVPDLTGEQLTIVFDQLPRLPVSDLRLDLSDGDQALLLTPPDCGEFAVKATFSPWADPETSFVALSQVEIAHGIGGGPCVPPEPPVDPDFEEPELESEAELGPVSVQPPAGAAVTAASPTPDSTPRAEKKRCGKGKRRAAARSKAHCGKKRCARRPCPGPRRSQPRAAG